MSNYAPLRTPLDKLNVECCRPNVVNDTTKALLLNVWNVPYKDNRLNAWSDTSHILGASKDLPVWEQYQE